MKISPRQEQHVKKYVKDYFEKVVAQKKAHEKKKTERRALQESKVGASKTLPTTLVTTDLKPEKHQDPEQGMEMSDEEQNGSKRGSATPDTPAGQGTYGDGLKRKRIDDHQMEGTPVEEQSTPTKRLKSETPPPPPPPPPPAGDTPQQSPFEGENAPHSLARLKLQNYKAPEFINGAELANSEPESPADKDSIPPPPPDSRHRGLAVGEFQDIDDDLANVTMEQSPDPAPTRPSTDFRHEGDEGQGGTFDLQHLSGAPKLPVGGGA